MLRGRSELLERREAGTDPRLGDDVARHVAGRLYLAAQVRDVDAEGLSVLGVFGTPHVLE